MSLNHPHSGVNYATEFQISSIPWVTSSTVPLGTTTVFPFSYVTKWITVQNNTSGSQAAVGVTQNGVEKSFNYILVDGGKSITLDWRLTRIYVSSSIGSSNMSVAAGLTSISVNKSDALYNLTASLGLSGVG